MADLFLRGFSDVDDVSGLDGVQFISRTLERKIQDRLGPWRPKFPSC